MAILDSAKIDLLYKQAFGVTKTDTPTNKSPSNEAIASPALIRGDRIWVDSDKIPAIAPASTSTNVTVYTTISAIKCTADATTTSIGGVKPTWITGLTDWIPPQFGSTYSVKVYADTASATNPQSTGTQLFPDSPTGEWYFDYMSGVLNFIGGSIPAALSGSKVIYIVGYRYTGLKGAASTDLFGNIIIANTTISTKVPGTDLVIAPNTANSSIANVSIANSNLKLSNSYGVFTDNLYYANGTVWDFQQAQGSNGSIQFNTNGDFDYSANLSFDKLTNTFSTYHVDATGNIVGGNLRSNALTATRVTFATTNGLLTDNQDFTFDSVSRVLTINGNISTTNIEVSTQITLDTETINVASNFVTLANANIYTTLNAGNTNINGIANVSNNTVSTSNTSGALVVAGGVGISGNIYVGSNATISGDLSVSSSANITNNLVVQGSANINDDLVVGGNLTVSGTTTYVDTTSTSIKDAIIELGGAGNGQNATSSDGFDRGILLHNYYASAENQFMGWDTSANAFVLLKNISGTSTITGTYANLSVYNVNANAYFGTVATGNQPNIANMSGLFDIAVSNLANINTAKLTNLYVSNIQYPTMDGAIPATNEVVALSTNGANVLNFSTIRTDRIANGSSNVDIPLSGGNVVTTVHGDKIFVVTTYGANVTGNLDVSDSISANRFSVNTLSASTRISIGNTAISIATANTATISKTTLAQVSAVSSGQTLCRAVEFFVKGEDAAGKYTVATITAIHDGSNVDFATYGKLHIGGTAGTFDVTFASGNMVLSVTPSSTNNTVWTTQFRTI